MWYFVIPQTKLREHLLTYLDKLMTKRKIAILYTPADKRSAKKLIVYQKSASYFVGRFLLDDNIGHFFINHVSSA